MKNTKLIFLTISLIVAVLLAGCGTAGVADLSGNNWTLVSYGAPANQANAVAGSLSQFTFGKDGKLSGNSGCNTFSGGYHVNGDKVSFDPMAATLKACEGAVMDQEAAVFQVLNGTAKYQLSSGNLVITSEKGDVAITLRKSDQ